MDDGILLRGTWQGKLPQPLSGQICVLAFANPASNDACLGSDVMNAAASKQAAVCEVKNRIHVLSCHFPGSSCSSFLLSSAH
jgi:hypothetical protein